MSGTSDNDMLMYMVQAAGSDPIDAEATSELVATDTLLKGFKAGSFFEVDTFSFTLDLRDDEGSGAGGGALAAATARALKERRSYARWRALGESTAKPKPPFLAAAQDVSISRKIDKSSPDLMKYCLDNKRFDAAVIVKRTRVGTDGVLACYLRLEFKKVRIKALQWNDGDTVSETCKFDFELMSGTYVMRKPDGTPASTWPCAWSKAPNV